MIPPIHRQPVPVECAAPSRPARSTHPSPAAPSRHRGCDPDTGRSDLRAHGAAPPRTRPPVPSRRSRPV